jgi:hypothetical protein
MRHLHRPSSWTTLLLSILALSAWAEEEITAVMTVRPVDGERYAAVELLLPEGQALSALRWYNNDASSPFAKVILMEATAELPPDLENSALILEEIEGPTLAYGTLSLEEPVSSSTGRAWAVFVYPDESDLSAKGFGGGVAVGIRESENPARTFLSHGGLQWIKLSEPHEMAIGVTLGSGKAGARSLAELARERGDQESEQSKPEPPITATTLHEPYPNPFNPRTTIRFDLHEAADLTLAIYNLRGQRVKTVETAALPAGRHERIWQGEDDAGRSVASGLYFVRLTIGQMTQVQRLVLVR